MPNPFTVIKDFITGAAPHLVPPPLESIAEAATKIPHLGEAVVGAGEAVAHNLEYFLTGKPGALDSSLDSGPSSGAQLFSEATAAKATNDPLAAANVLNKVIGTQDATDRNLITLFKEQGALSRFLTTPYDPNTPAFQPFTPQGNSAVATGSGPALDLASAPYTPVDQSIQAIAAANPRNMELYQSVKDPLSAMPAVIEQNAKYASSSSPWYDKVLDVAAHPLSGLKAVGHIIMQAPNRIQTGLAYDTLSLHNAVPDAHLRYQLAQHFYKDIFEHGIFFGIPEATQTVREARDLSVNTTMTEQEKQAALAQRMKTVAPGGPAGFFGDFAANAAFDPLMYMPPEWLLAPAKGVSKIAYGTTDLSRAARVLPFIGQGRGIVADSIAEGMSANEAIKSVINMDNVAFDAGKLASPPRGVANWLMLRRPAGVANEFSNNIMNFVSTAVKGTGLDLTNPSDLADLEKSVVGNKAVGRVAEVVPNLFDDAAVARGAAVISDPKFLTKASNDLVKGNFLSQLAELPADDPGVVALNGAVSKLLGRPATMEETLQYAKSQMAGEITRGALRTAALEGQRARFADSKLAMFFLGRVTPVTAMLREGTSFVTLNNPGFDFLHFVSRGARFAFEFGDHPFQASQNAWDALTSQIGGKLPERISAMITHPLIDGNPLELERGMFSRNSFQDVMGVRNTESLANLDPSEFSGRLAKGLNQPTRDTLSASRGAMGTLVDALRWPLRQASNIDAFWRRASYFQALTEQVNSAIVPGFIAKSVVPDMTEPFVRLGLTPEEAKAAQYTFVDEIKKSIFGKVAEAPGAAARDVLQGAADRTLAKYSRPGFVSLPSPTEHAYEVWAASKGLAGEGARYGVTSSLDRQVLPMVRNIMTEVTPATDLDSLVTQLHGVTSEFEDAHLLQSEITNQTPLTLNPNNWRRSLGLTDRIAQQEALDNVNYTTRLHRSVYGDSWATSPVTDPATGKVMVDPVRGGPMTAQHLYQNSAREFTTGLAERTARTHAAARLASENGRTAMRPGLSTAPRLTLADFERGVSKASAAGANPLEAHAQAAAAFALSGDSPTRETFASLVDRENEAIQQILSSPAKNKGKLVNEVKDAFQKTRASFLTGSGRMDWAPARDDLSLTHYSKAEQDVLDPSKMGTGVAGTGRTQQELLTRPHSVDYYRRGTPPEKVVQAASPVKNEVNVRAALANYDEYARRAVVSAPTVAAAPLPAPSGEVSLPSTLSGAKPRYNVGTASFTPTFESDTDKALFIVAQTKLSAKDESYMEFLRRAFPGASDGDIRLTGKSVRAEIGRQAKVAAAQGSDELKIARTGLAPSRPAVVAPVPAPVGPKARIDGNVERAIQKDGYDGYAVGNKVTLFHGAVPQKADIVDQLLEATTKEGGSTLSLSGAAPDKAAGFSVGAFPERSTIPEKGLTKTALENFIKDNRDVLSRPGYNVGTWVLSSEDAARLNASYSTRLGQNITSFAEGDTVLDISQVVKNQNEAIQLGASRGQDSVYDLKKGDVVPVPEDLRKTLAVNDQGRMWADWHVAQKEATTNFINTNRLLAANDPTGVASAKVEAWGADLLKTQDTAAEARSAALREGTTEAYKTHAQIVGKAYQENAIRRGQIFGLPTNDQASTSFWAGDHSTPHLLDVSSYVDSYIDALKKAWPDFKSGKILPVGQSIKSTLGDTVAQMEKDWPSVRQQFMGQAQAKTDFVNLNYNNGFGIDSVMNAFAPFSFWPTRDAINWAVRFGRNPAAFAAVTQWMANQEQYSKTYGLPARMKWDIPMYLPGLDQFLQRVPLVGSLMAGTDLSPIRAIDPLQFMFPYKDFTKQLDNQSNQGDTPAGQVLSWVENHTPLSAYPFAKTIGVETGLLDKNAWQSTYYGGGPFGLPLTPAAQAAARWFYTGDTTAISPNEQGIYMQTGHFTPNLLMRILGVSDNKWSTYTAERAVWTLAADNKLLPGQDHQTQVDAAWAAIQSHSGPAWNAAVKDAQGQAFQQELTRWAGFPFGGVKGMDKGEKMWLSLKPAYDTAAQNGQLDMFFTKYPEFQVRSAVTKGLVDPKEEAKAVDTQLYYTDLEKVVNQPFQSQVDAIQQKLSDYRNMAQTEPVRQSISVLETEMASINKDKADRRNLINAAYPNRETELSLNHPPEERALMQARQDYAAIQQKPGETYQELKLRQAAELQKYTGTATQADWDKVYSDYLQTRLKYGVALNNAYDQGNYDLVTQLKTENDTVLQAVHAQAQTMLSAQDVQNYLNLQKRVTTKEEDKFKEADGMFQTWMSLVGKGSLLSSRQKGAIDAYFDAQPAMQEYFTSNVINPRALTPEQDYALSQWRTIWKTFHTMSDPNTQLDYIHTQETNLQQYGAALGLTPPAIMDYRRPPVEAPGSDPAMVNMEMNIALLRKQALQNAQPTLSPGAVKQYEDILAASPEDPSSMTADDVQYYLDAYEQPVDSTGQP